MIGKSYNRFQRTAMLSTCLGMLALLTFAGSVATGGNAILPKDGDYRGFQSMENLSPDEKDTKWFHENFLIIRNNEAVLDMSPVFFTHGKRGYSASDGGFLTYRGRFLEKDGQCFVQMRLFRSDYVGFKVGTDPYKEVKVYAVKYSAGIIEFNGGQYKPTRLKEDERKDLLKFLSQESVEVEKKPYR